MSDYTDDYTRLDSMISEYFKDKPNFSRPVKINHAVKRTLDVILGSAGLIISTPLIAALGIITLYDSGSPMLFKQERIGYRGRHITVYKIRTMHNGTDEKVLNGQIDIRDIYADMHNSPVYTKFGKVLDYTHLNELPQLWNVIKGEMSLVGNRPISLHHLKMLIDVDGYMEKFNSKPGLLGYAQLQFRPLNIPEAVKKEQEYSKTYNTGNVLAEDWKIFRLTLKKYHDMLRPNRFRGYTADSV